MVTFMQQSIQNFLFWVLSLPPLQTEGSGIPRPHNFSTYRSTFDRGPRHSQLRFLCLPNSGKPRISLDDNSFSNDVEILNVHFHRVSRVVFPPLPRFKVWVASVLCLCMAVEESSTSTDSTIAYGLYSCTMLISQDIWTYFQPARLPQPCWLPHVLNPE